jgi:aryl-phospho-beta-D-glucosidase BglC (GH1 family)
LLLLLLSIIVLPSCAQTSSPAWKRAEHLRHGINASEWFAQSRDYSAQRLRTYTTLDDIVRMKQMGFDHVRLSIDPAIFECPLDPQAPTNRAPASWEKCPTVQALDEVIAKALSQDLAVVIDLHPSGLYKARLATNDTAVEQLTILWGRIAAYYAKLDPDRVFFEVMNEPEMADVFRWGGIEQRAVAEIRSNAPRHTILVSGANYSDIADLVRLPQFAEPNLIFVFHYYEPHIFTHQGASWGEPFWNTLRQVPFPGSNTALADAMAKQTDDYARFKLTQFGLDHWDEQHVASEIQFAADWAKARQVPLICDEFGVYRYFVRPEDRQHWLSTVRSALEQDKIGWTMWDYQGGFGVVSKDSGTTVEDEGVLKALGLR